MKKIVLNLYFLIFIFPNSLFSNTERDLLSRPMLDNDKISKAIIVLTNIERVKRGLPLLRYNNILQAGAERHSRYMAENRVMTHSENVLRDPEDRVQASCPDKNQKYMEQFNSPFANVSGRSYSVCCGENVIESSALNDSYKRYYINHDEKGTYKDWGGNEVHWRTEIELARDMVNRWMNSPGHRANILHKEYGAMGAAVSYCESNNKYYGTQVFSPLADGAIDYDSFPVQTIVKSDNEIQIFFDPGSKLAAYKISISPQNSQPSYKVLRNNNILKVQISDLKIDSPLLFIIEIEDLKNPSIKYSYWRFQVFIKDNIPAWDWVNW